MDGVILRPARRDEVATIVELIRELAEFEHATEEVLLDDGALEAALFCADPAVFVHVADKAGAVVAIAVWFRTFSTWTGRHGIYLEDLFVREEERGKGIGTALLVELARIAVERGYRRLEWSVLDWNTPAIEFYAALGAVAKSGWTVNRVAGAALAELAEAAGKDAKPQ
jgi:GNAT superfamily N-acetyltransferase